MHIITSEALAVTRWVHWYRDGSSQESEKRVGLGSVDVNFREDIKVGLESVTRSDILQGVQEFLVVLVRLMTELVARETKNSKIVAVG